ncbi:MAG: hypothetical protein BA870_10105 [Desulfuromonadales bacterium C00003094]|jgi:hypothetical protein|nr:MAG: hypothetical protein BA870_10105 [Desulfuromonadales bacterium C00003094]
MANWIAWDVIEEALTKTSQMLFEPFDLKKWVKLAVILFFIGGCGSYGSHGGGGGPSYTYNLQGNDFVDPGGRLQPDAEMGAVIEQAVAELSAFVDRSRLAIILAVTLIFMIILLFSYISNIMEFALVESVVRSQVTLKAYIGNNLGNALQLFVLKWTLNIIFLLAIILSLLPALSTILDGNFNITILGSVFLFFSVVIVGGIIFVLIDSFINLAIPVMLYENTGIISALLRLTDAAVHNVSQLLVYWVLWILLGIVICIVVTIIGIIVVLLAALALALIGIAGYMILTLLGIGFFAPTFLIVIGLYIIVAILTIVFLVTLATVPLPVFMKYHALLFLQKWYADIVPFQEDALVSE